MDIFEFAMQMERDGMLFYERGVESTDDSSMKKVFQMLADEEERHYKLFKNLKEGNDLNAEKELAPQGQTTTLAKNIFREMAESGKETLKGSSAKSIWEEALIVEQKAEKMYREAAEKETEIKRKSLLNRIADEEKSHIYLCDNMIAFLNDPASFATSQQYKSFMSWEGR